MVPKVSIFVATSLDGSIARKDGSIDWLDRANAGVPQGEDGGFNDFMNSVDALVMGRNTFEQVLSFGKWPYGNKPVVVLSKNTVAIPSTLKETVSVSQEQPKELLIRLGNEGAKHIYVDGGFTIQSFLKHNLIDELTITLIPVVLSEGKPLFANIGNDVLFEHLATKTFDFGFVQLKFRGFQL